MKRPEEIMHLKVCDYLRKNYPDVIFRTDFSSGMRMTPAQAAKHKKFQKSRAWPDLFIAKSTMKIEYNRYAGEQFLDGYAGLFLELKAEGTQLYKKDGTLRKNKHIEEQVKMLEKLNEAGYCAMFAVGYEDTICKIEQYLGKPIKKEVEF
jgi:hypothetical protein